MTKPSCPTVRHDGLHDKELPAVLKIPSSYQEMKGSAWEEWLMNHRKFRFDTIVGTFSAYKSQGYWKAQRRVNGKLRGQHLGQSHELIFPKLDAIARKLALRPANYEKAKVRPSRYSSEELAEIQSHKKHETKHRFGCTTIEDYQLTIEQFIDERRMLKAQIKELKQRELTPQKCDRILNIGLPKDSPQYQWLKRELIEAFGGDWRNQI